MTHLKRGYWKRFQIFREQKAGQFSMQELTILGSNFGANQQPVVLAGVFDLDIRWGSHRGPFRGVTIHPLACPQRMLAELLQRQLTDG
jgi:hypothetical protein